MDVNEVLPEEEVVNQVKTFCQAAKEVLAGVLNERKASLPNEVCKSTVKRGLEELMPYWNDFSADNFESTDYESVLEAERIFLTLTLIYKGLFDDTVGAVEKAVDISVLDNLLKSFWKFLESAQSQNRTDMIKTIKSTRRIKFQVIMLTLICFSMNREDGVHVDNESGLGRFLSKEDIYTAFLKIVPKPYNYNLYMNYYQPFLQYFWTSIQDTKLRNTMMSALETVGKSFPESTVLPFEERYGIVLKKLGWESNNLEDCCSRIETSAYALASESPIEMSLKMHNLWLLLEASKFLSFDDNCMAIYVFSSELPVFHTQIMRIFYILNRIDESVRDIGYLSYSTPVFLNHYIGVYTELHTWFARLIRGLSKNYEIYEVECDKLNGAIRRKAEGRPLISAELKELSIYMTCPLATLDSILRMSFELTDVPLLLDEEQEKFIFTTPPSNLLSLHDFIASDREKFATHTVELYPCLDRHFQRFHKSKKSDQQGINTALPPSYHLFAKTIHPPEYQLYYAQPMFSQINQTPMSASDIEAQQILNSINDKDNDSKCCFCMSNIVPALFFFILLVILIIFAVSSF